MRLFGSSGIRGIVDKDFVLLAFKVGLAVGEIYKNVVVGSDTRTSRAVIRHALLCGLLAAGADYSDAGIVPTPTLALAASKYDAGAMITASHNPPEYNGIKLFNPDGSSFAAAQQEQIEEKVLNGSSAMAEWSELKGGGAYEGAIEQHIVRIMQDFPNKLKIKAVVDAGCGAASVITPLLLKKLGCEVIELNCSYSGFFPRGSEPVESNLTDLMKAVKDSGAALGIAHDGDADRMMAVDDKGRFITGDRLLMVFARELGAKEVVTTVDASMAVDEMGFKVRRTRVGDTWVSYELKNGGDFGGEASGAWVFPTVSLCPDGIYAAAKIAAIAGRQKLSGLVDAIPSYPLLRGSVGGRAALPRLELKLKALKPLSLSNSDGIRLSFDDGWLLIRASGTEPKIRLTAEARDEARVRQLYDGGLRAIKDCIE